MAEWTLEDCTECGDGEANRRALRAELAALRKDKARVDALEQKVKTSTLNLSTAGGLGNSRVTYAIRGGWWCEVLTEGATLREALDKLMEGE